MASKGSGFSYGLRKITQADRDLIQREIKEFNMPKTGDYVIDKMVNEKERGYVAFSGKKIIGFVLLQQPGHGILRVDGLYLRTGYEKRGIGSKLLGKANAFAVKTGAKQVRLEAGHGRHIVEGREKLVASSNFYNKTNLRKVPNALIPIYRWWVQSKKKNPKLSPKKSLPKGIRRK